MTESFDVRLCFRAAENHFSSPLKSSMFANILNVIEQSNESIDIVVTSASAVIKAIVAQNGHRKVFPRPAQKKKVKFQAIT
jgi:hypothetical protein